MSLSTLLEAARYLELQEQQEQRQRQHRAALESALAAAAAARPVRPLPPLPPPPPPVPQVVQQPQQQQQQRGAVSSTTGGCGAATQQQQQPPPPQQQAVVVAAAPAVPQILQGPIAFSAPTTNQQPVVKKIEQDGQISSTTMTQNQKHRILQNSFDIMSPLIIDESNIADQKKIIRQPPMVFRAGTREVHNKLEKHRRAHLKECFDLLKKQLPSNSEEKKTSNLSILHSALRYIQTLKRKERELEHEMESLAREKISSQQKLAVLKKEISSHHDVDFSKLLPETMPPPLHNHRHHEGLNGSIGIPSELKLDATQSSSPNGNVNGEKIAIPVLSKTSLSLVNQTTVAGIKEITQQPVQTTALSVVPMSYPVNQGLVLQKVAIVPNGLKDLAPLVSTHFITTPQPLNGINGQLNGKVVPLAQYLVKPVVVVSTASPRPSS